MQKYLLILLIFCFISCERSNTKIKERSYEILSTGKTINYRYSKLTIQGSTENDTTFIEQFGAASFWRNASDTIVGYKYFIQDSLIHPYFGVPLKTIYHYDGHRFNTGTISSIQLSLKDQSYSELNKEVYHNVMAGQVPVIMKLIKADETAFLEDSIIADEKCKHLFTEENGLPHHLFISKKTHLPVMMRVVTNYFQPFIQEYYYSDFMFSPEFNIPDYKAEINQHDKPTIHPVLKKGDQMPEWSLLELSGKNVSMKASGKIRVIYFSMINCGPCQAAIPYVEQIYNTYKNSEVVDFHILYPYDTKDKLNKYVRTKNISAPILYNSYDKEPERTGLIMSLKFAYPSVLIVDHNNEIVEIIHGFSTGLREKIQKSVKRILEMK
jgi:thiol-disulfide isomerase/thioredoxin